MNQLIPPQFDDAITIENVELPVIEIEGQRVVTLSMVDKVHQRPDGTAGRNFREHRHRLIETEDYFQMSSDEIRRNSPSAIPETVRRNDVILMTESGYLMLVKSFTDDLAWDVQRKLVNGYFRVMGAQPRAIAAASDLTPLKVTVEAAKAFPALVRAARLLGCDQNAAAIAANQAVMGLTQVNLAQQLGRTHLEAENQESRYYTPTELGRMIDASARGVNLLLAEAGMQFKRGDAWEVTEAGREFARIFDTSKRHGSGVPITQIKWASAVLPLLGESKQSVAA